MGVGVAHFYFSYYLCVRDYPANKKKKNENWETTFRYVEVN
jgi:hypothetical protein